MGFDQDRSGELSGMEMQKCMADIGLRPRSKAEQQFWKEKMDRADEDHDGTYSFEEYMNFVAEVREFRQQEAEREDLTYGIELGVPQDEIAGFRDAYFKFCNEDGEMAVQDLRRMLVAVGRPVNSNALHQMFKEVAKTDPGTSSSASSWCSSSRSSLIDRRWHRLHVRVGFHGGVFFFSRKFESVQFSNVNFQHFSGVLKCSRVRVLFP